MEEESNITAKVVVVGDTGVGKTCLLQILNKEKFKETQTPTISPSFQCFTYKDHDNNEANLQIWDTAGQEKYHSVSQLFFRNADIAFVCFAAGDADSMKSCHLWIEMIKNQSPDCHLIMIITKQDMLPNQASEILSAADNEFGGYNVKGVYLTSAKTKFGIEEMISAAGELAIENGKPRVVELESNTQSRGYCC